jgi:hypothetical protein
MTIYEKIVLIYPELANYNFIFGDIRLQNDSDGKGDYIKEWNHPTLTRPTEAQLEAAE